MIKKDGTQTIDYSLLLYDLGLISTRMPNVNRKSLLLLQLNVSLSSCSMFCVHFFY
jgi:hypothetical protein